MYTYIYPRRTSVRVAVALLRFGRSRPLHISRVSKRKKVGEGYFPARTMLPSLEQSTYPQMAIFSSRTTRRTVISTPQSYVLPHTTPACASVPPWISSASAGLSPSTGAPRS